METGYLQHQGEENLPNNHKFRETIGMLMYISTFTRPDITAAVHLLSRKSENPSQYDWQAAKRIVGYLKGTQDEKLRIESKGDHIKMYVDADWGQDKESRKSTSGFTVFFGNSCVSWKSKKQTSVALSTCEAEYIALSESAKELLWILQLAKDMELHQNNPVQVFEDNQATIKVAECEKSNFRMKHLDIKYHKVRELIKEKTIQLHHCPSEQMIADILTKPIPRPRFQYIKHQLGIMEHGYK